jgi:hypothetical protein
MHARQQILDAVGAILSGVATPPWRGVYIAGMLPGLAQMPCLLVRAEGETVQPLDVHTGQSRIVSLSTIIVAKAWQNPEDTTASLNDMSARIETALTQAALIALVEIASITLASVEITEEADDNGFVGIDHRWEIEYLTRIGAPEVFY